MAEKEGFIISLYIAICIGVSIKCSVCKKYSNIQPFWIVIFPILYINSFIFLINNKEIETRKKLQILALFLSFTAVFIILECIVSVEDDMKEEILIQNIDSDKKNTVAEVREKYIIFPKFSIARREIEEKFICLY